jgi:hypothetical protein
MLRECDVTALTVPELKAALVQRGLRIPRFKAGLVPQLEKAVREENLQAAARAEAARAEAARALKAARRPPAPSEALSEEVFRNLGSLISAHLTLGSAALITFRVDHKLHELSRARIAALLPRLSPLLHAPYLNFRSLRDLLEVESLNLANMGINNSSIATLASACSVGALVQVKTLDLTGNPCPTGVEQLISAIAKGALPNLESLNLANMGINNSSIGTNHPCVTLTPLKALIELVTNGAPQLNTLTVNVGGGVAGHALREACDARGIRLYGHGHGAYVVAPGS